MAPGVHCRRVRISAVCGWPMRPVGSHKSAEQLSHYAGAAVEGQLQSVTDGWP